MTLPGRLILLALVALLVLPAAASAQEDKHSDNMSLVKNIPYDAKEQYGQDIPYGTDIEFVKRKDRRFAFAGSELNGLQIFEITNPKSTRLIRNYDCAVSQGDPQVFRQPNHIYVTYTNDYEDTKATAGSACYRQAEALGFDAIDENGNARLGTMIIDVSSPFTPKAASFVPITRGSHNMTVHPSGKYLYNSNSDLAGFGWPPAIEIYDISNLKAPKQTDTVSLTPLPGLGADSHDITFNKEGTRAYSAALSHGVILNTENPADAEIVSEFDDESINVWHQSDPVTIGDRELLIVEDEVAGAAAPGVCPTGGVHVFDISDESLPVKVGYWNIDDIATRDPLDTCTAHVFDIHEEEQIMTIAYYMGGVRVVDLSGLADAPIGVGQGDQALGGAMKEIGYYVTPDANTWSAKTPFIEPDGDFYLYGDDINRGLDVYRFEAEDAVSENPGEFTAATKAQAEQTVAGLDLAGLTQGQQRTQSSEQQSLRVYCLLKGLRRQ